VKPVVLEMLTMEMEPYTVWHTCYLIQVNRRRLKNHLCILFAPVPHGCPCSWWAHWGMASRLSFGLGPAGSREDQPSHQALSDESQPQAWLQGGTPSPPYWATVSCLDLIVLMKVS
ncbi:hypothetical protein XENORESO_021069, partial [Xenotaenia resolanae]